MAWATISLPHPDGPVIMTLALVLTENRIIVRTDAMASLFPITISDIIFFGTDDPPITTYFQRRLLQSQLLNDPLTNR